MGCGGSKKVDDAVAPTRAADQDAAAATVQAAVRGNLSRQASKQKLESQKSIGESIAEGISNLFAPAPADAATETGAPGTAERRGSAASPSPTGGERQRTRQRATLAVAAHRARMQSHRRR